MFVVFEGGDGAGKTTQSRLLAEWLEEQGRTVVRTRQPGGTALGTKVRELVLDPSTGDVDPRAEALLYSADKAQHVAEVIRPALASGADVVCDRYVDSMIAYQGAGRVLDPAEITKLARWATGGLCPDLTVLLDVDPDDALAAKDLGDRLESAGESFHHRVREGFLALAEEDPGRHLVVPARGARDEIAARVRDAVTRLRERPGG